MPPTRRRSGIARRLAAALRIRALHGTVLRRIDTLASRGELPPELPRAIRSKTRPCWSPAAAAPIRSSRSPSASASALVGALSVESAARALNARDIDGMVIGDGFGPRIVEALLTVLAEDVRFRDLPVAVLGGHPAVIEPFCPQLPNLDRIAEGPDRLVERFLPFVRLHAFGQRLAPHAQIARRQGHDRSRHRAARRTRRSGAISTAPSTMPKSAASGCRSRASRSTTPTAASASMPRGWSAG